MLNPTSIWRRAPVKARQLATWQSVYLYLLAVCIGGCASTNGQREFLAINYQRAATVEGPDRNPVLVIPGLLGSTLRDSSNDEFVWGGFDRVSANPTSQTGLRALALPFEVGAGGRVNADDGIEPTWVLQRARVRVLGLPFNLDVYAGILQALGVGGYRDESLGTAGAIDYGDDHFTCFQFPYDWRRDIVESAQRLYDFVATQRGEVQSEYEERFGIRDADVRFDIVAHSMGGLVARYFLMYGNQDLPADGSMPELTWAGAKFVERVILVGTPNAGSALTLRNMINGWSLGLLQPRYSAALLGTYPSTYQLLPRAGGGGAIWDDTGESVGDLYSPVLWQQLGWGLASPSADRELRMLLPTARDAGERELIAKTLQSRLLSRARQFHAALDRPAKLPNGTSMMLVIGDSQPTAAAIEVSRTNGNAKVARFGDGDGTVLRTSVLHDTRSSESWVPMLQTPIDYDQALFLPQSHTGLTSDPTFTDNILHWLLEDPR